MAAVQRWQRRRNGDLVPGLLWVETNRAHALLFPDRTEEAKTLGVDYMPGITDVHTNAAEALAAGQDTVAPTGVMMLMPLRTTNRVHVTFRQMASRLVGKAAAAVLVAIVRAELVDGRHDLLVAGPQ
jgi:hypothetical protein